MIDGHVRYRLRHSLKDLYVLMVSKDLMLSDHPCSLPRLCRVILPQQFLEREERRKQHQSWDLESWAVDALDRSRVDQEQM